MHSDTRRSSGSSDSEHGQPASDRRSVEERRQQLIDAALTVMADQGLARATTRAITDEAGLALGAFHYAFTSKDELLSATIEHVVAEIDAALARTLDAAEPRAGDPSGQALVVEVLTRFLERTWEYLQSTPELQLAQYELTLHALREPSLRHLAERQYSLYCNTVATALGELTEEIGASAAADLSRYVVATIDGLLLQWLVEGDDAAAQLRLRRYLTTLPAIVQAHSDPPA